MDKTIFDLGMHYGLNTRFYLDHGFRVVGVEANPNVVADLLRKFSTEIAESRLQIVSKCISDTVGRDFFYANLDVDLWSSTSQEAACRQNSQFQKLLVETVSIVDLLKTYGNPYYLKIDLEDSSSIALKQLGRSIFRPEFISVHDNGSFDIEDIFSLGYNKFAFVAQNTDLESKKKPSDVCNAQEQNCRLLPFMFGNSSENWLSYDAARIYYRTHIRSQTGSYIGEVGNWYDIHAAYFPR